MLDFALRRTGVTASEVATACGLNPWGSPHDLFLEKLGRGKPKEDNPGMKRGRRLEQYILQTLHEDLGRPIVSNSEQVSVVSKRNPLVIATPDGYALEHNGLPPAVVEVKSPGMRTLRQWTHPDEMADGIPAYYWPQVLWQMYACEMDHAIFAGLIPGEDIWIYHLTFNRKLFDALLARVEKFWGYVQRQEPPPSPPLDFVNTWYKQAGQELANDESVNDAARELARLRAVMKDAKESADRLEVSIKEAIGTGAGVEGSWGRATWKQVKSSAKTDWESLAKDLKPSGEMVNRHTTIKPGYRRFLLKLKGEENVE